MDTTVFKIKIDSLVFVNDTCIVYPDTVNVPIYLMNNGTQSDSQLGLWFGLAGILLAVGSLLFAYFNARKTKSNIDELNKISNHIADYTRKPLYDIIDILLAIYRLTKNSLNGCKVYYVGFTLGLGVPHLLPSKEQIWKEKCPYHSSFLDKILQFNHDIRAIIASSDHKKSLIITYGKKDDPLAHQKLILNNFIDGLYRNKDNYCDDAKNNTKEILNNLLKIEDHYSHFSKDDLEVKKEEIKAFLSSEDIDNEKKLSKIIEQNAKVTHLIHRLVIDKVKENHRLVYSDNIPLQMIITESDIRGQKKYCGVVFNIGSGYYEKESANNNKSDFLGFYTELEDICQIFINYAETIALEPEKNVNKISK